MHTTKIQRVEDCFACYNVTLVCSINSKLSCVLICTSKHGRYADEWLLYSVLYSFEFSLTVDYFVGCIMHYPTTGRESFRGYVMMLGPAKIYLFVNNEFLRV